MSHWCWGTCGILVAALIIVSLLLLRWYIRTPMYYGKARIDGKVVVITGGNTGIGKETAKDLLSRGARVIILCRDMKRGNAAAEELMEHSGSNVAVYKLDLADLDSVRKCAAILKEKEQKIDILINNAGVMATPQMETKDGFEMQFGTNHLGHFLLTLLLLDNIKAAAPSRIINVSSHGHNFGKMNWDDLNNRNKYSPFNAYTQSKLANVLFTKSLAEKLKGTEVTTYVLHPGAVQTELHRHVSTSYGHLADLFSSVLAFIFFKTSEQGAQTSIYCAVDEQIAKETGKYYSRCKEKASSSLSQNMDDAERLWKISLKMVGLDGFST